MRIPGACADIAFSTHILHIVPLQRHREHRGRAALRIGLIAALEHQRSVRVQRGIHPGRRRDRALRQRGLPVRRGQEKAGIDPVCVLRGKQCGGHAGFERAGRHVLRLQAQKPPVFIVQRRVQRAGAVRRHLDAGLDGPVVAEAQIRLPQRAAGLRRRAHRQRQQQSQEQGEKQQLFHGVPPDFNVFVMLDSE